MKRRRLFAIHTSRHAKSEYGAVALLTAVATIMLLVAAAMVLDFGLARMDRQVNKSAADAAVAAGLRGVDNGNGLIYSYQGACEALETLKANEPALASLNWADCSNSPQLSKVCNAARPATHAHFTGSADGFQVEIKIPYDLATSGFAEEELPTLQNDQGDGALGGCDQLAVILTRSRGPGLGVLVGASQIRTTVRTVGRVIPGEDDELPVALLLLEQTECKTLNVSGSGTSVRVDGNGPAPGLIQTDSTGQGSSCTGSARVINTSTPNGVVAGAAATAPLDDSGNPVGSPLSGVIGSNALQSGNTTYATAELDFVYGESNPIGTKTGPIARPATGRTPLDKSYRVGVKAAITDANTAWSQKTGYSLPAGQSFETQIGSNPTASCPAPTAAQKSATALVFNCSPSYNSDANAVYPNAKTVIIMGQMTKRLSFPVADRVFLRGASGNSDAIKLSSGSDYFRMHQGPTDPTTCADTIESERARLVIWGGSIAASGGLLQFCHTAVIQMGAYDSGCVPSADGEIPQLNPCPGDTNLVAAGNGILDSSGRVEWTAPNRMESAANPALSTDREDLEDLALWTESASSSHKLTGGSLMHLKGVFFLPNAYPFNLHGGAGQLAKDAQYIVRSLNATGGAQVYMQPNAYNAPKLPTLESFTLVR